MRVISFNANGIRSAIRKGFFEWVQIQDPDIICIQETKIKSQECKSLEEISLPGYHVVYEDAEKRGYSGVAIFSKKTPESYENQLGMPESDAEGRFLQFNFPHFSVVSVYMPSGTSGEGRQEVKMAFLEHFYTYLDKQLKSGKRLIICGDWNIAHQTIDLKNWKSNQKNSGFLPEERAWLDQVFAMGYIDAFRVLNSSSEQYSWWSLRTQARAKNVGWRIDYQVVTPNLREQIQRVEIISEPFFSDHAPVMIDYQGLEYV
jgi:exodeoxyribonuclease III